MTCNTTSTSKDVHIPPPLPVGNLKQTTAPAKKPAIKEIRQTVNATPSRLNQPLAQYPYRRFEQRVYKNLQGTVGKIVSNAVKKTARQCTNNLGNPLRESPGGRSHTEGEKDGQQEDAATWQQVCEHCAANGGNENIQHLIDSTQWPAAYAQYSRGLSASTEEYRKQLTDIIAHISTRPNTNKSKLRSVVTWNTGGFSEGAQDFK